MLKEDVGPEAKKAKFAPPTVEEVAALRENEGIFTGRLNQLKIDEILKEIKLNDMDIENLRKAYHTLSSEIKNCTVMETIDLESLPGELILRRQKLSFFSAKIGSTFIPMSMKPSSVKGQMPLIPPDNVNLCNELTFINLDGHNANVAIKIPSQCLQEKDYWDERFFRKRAIYLGT